jgi:hypothetical protein
MLFPEQCTWIDVIFGSDPTPFTWMALPVNSMSEPSSTSTLGNSQPNRGSVKQKMEAGPAVENHPPSYDQIQLVEFS